MADKKPENAVEKSKLIAQAEEQVAKLVQNGPTAAQKKAIDARLKTAITLLPLLKPIAAKYNVPVEELLAVHLVETRGEESPMGGVSSAKASGPFQIVPDTRAAHTPSQQYGTTVEADADIAAQLLREARDAGFELPEAVGMTYITGIHGLKRWGGGDDKNGHVGEQSMAYAPMFGYAIRAAKAAAPKYGPVVARESEQEAKIAGAQARQKAFDAFKTPTRMREGLGAYFGPSEEEAQAAREARMLASEETGKVVQTMTGATYPYTKPRTVGYK